MEDSDSTFFCLAIVGFQVASGFDHVRVVLALTRILYAHTNVLYLPFPGISKGTKKQGQLVHHPHKHPRAELIRLET